MRRRALLALVVPAVLAAAACGDREPTASPALPPADDTLLSTARVGALPPAERPGWVAYLDSSRAAAARDRAAVDVEARAAGLSSWQPAPVGPDFYVQPWMSNSYFYTGATALADAMLTWQTPAGGWSKAVDVSRPRQPGTSFSSTNSWSWISTFDNGATTEELRFLGRVVLVQGGGAAYQAAFMKGLAFVLAAQFPNGCWPQVYPLEGSYHDAATFNDAATVRVLSLLGDVARGFYTFVPAAERARAADAVSRGIACVTAAQVVAGGKRTVWGQQHDPLTLAPVKGRAYEPASLCSLESAGVVDYLMTLDPPPGDVAAAVRGAAAWLRANAIYGYEYRQPDLVPAPGAGPLWARFYELGTGRPIFGDRDSSVHYVLGEISLERRLGYAWYTSSPAATLSRFDTWAARH